MIKVINGIRRCGKSYLLFNLFRGYLEQQGVQTDHIIEIAFDSFENKKYRNPEILYPYLNAQITVKDMYYILLGEVQLLDDFESFIDQDRLMGNVEDFRHFADPK